MPSSAKVRLARRANFKRLLAPKSMAFIGGAQIEYTLNTLRDQTYSGPVFVVNPKRSQIAGFACLPSIAALPMTPDAVFLAVHADATVDALRQLAQKKAGGVVCYASGFAEIGGVGLARQRDFVAAAGEMAVVGPNCYGLVNYVHHSSLWPTPYPKLRGCGGAAVLAQSGNVTGHLVANARAVPYAYLISIGNQAVLGFEDYIDYLLDDPHVTCFGLFIEGIRDLTTFTQACLRARAQHKPVVVYRSGRSELGVKIAASHTSALVGQHAYYQALFARLGVIETDTIPQFLEMLKLASLAPRMGGNRLAVFSSSGGDNGLAADCCAAAGLSLPVPDPCQVDALQALLPPFSRATNPLDFTSDYWGKQAPLTALFTTFLQGEVDAGMLVVDYPPLGLAPYDKTAHQAMDRALAAAGRASGKPVFHTTVIPESLPSDDAADMIAQGIIPLHGVHDAAQVIAQWLAWRASEPTTVPAPWVVPPLTSEGVTTLNEAESKRRLADYGVPVPPGRAWTLAELATLPERLDAPMVLKVLHDALPHKTEVGGVVLDVRERAQAVAAARQMVAAVAVHDPQITLTQFWLEPMQPTPLAELMVGVKRDAVFGLVLVVGAGGVFVEVLRDTVVLLLPVMRDEVASALRRLKSFALFDGFRGRACANLDAVIDAIMAIATYASDHRYNLVTLDVNPFMVFEHTVVAVDALIIEQRA